jgi:hypothetical protein
MLQKTGAIEYLSRKSYHHSSSISQSGQVMEEEFFYALNRAVQKGRLRRARKPTSGNVHKKGRSSDKPSLPSSFSSVPLILFLHPFL